MRAAAAVHEYSTSRTEPIWSAAPRRRFRGVNAIDQVNHQRVIIRRYSRSYIAASSQRRACRNLSAFPITETELRLIAALAIIGDNSHPKMGYSTPAATGIPSVL